MHAFSIFLALLVGFCVADNYWRYPFTSVNEAHNLDSIFFEINEDDSHSIPKFITAMKKACSARPDCKGFTSDGRLLRNTETHERESSPSMDLYVKMDEPQAAQPNIWPLPQSVTQGSSILEVSPNFKFTPTPTFPDIQFATAWVSTFTFQHKASSRATDATTLPSLIINVQNPSAPLQIGVDETYTLSVPADGTPAILKSVSYYGALNGLQTFSQLVNFNFTTHTYQIHNAPYFISDAPRYAHRGLLMDTSRHFQPLPVLKRLIESLAYAKFNVLHWHIVDEQAFPYESTTYPKLWNAAWSEVEKYTQDDIADVVEYSRLRGVRVMVEFDTPGHAASWCNGYPEVCPSTTCLEPLNPATEQTFTLIKNLFAECTGNTPGGGLFPSTMIHLGGDEVDTACWTKTPSVAQWLKSMNFTADQAYYYFVNRVLDIVLAQGRDPVNWEEVYNHFGKQLNTRAIVHAWYDFSTVAKAARDGYRVLNSANWYLDHLGDLWTDYYKNDPRQGITDPTQQQLVLGGECCMWGETVDPSDVFNTIWPRAAAVSERLWSSASTNDASLAMPRYESFRCLLTRRGINAAPSHNTQARQPPPQPGSCLAQR